MVCAAIVVGCNTAREHPSSVGSAPDAAVPPAVPLCNGSDDFRLLVNDERYGPARGLHSFEYPHNTYFVVDGHCRYIATWDYMLGIRQGELSDSELSSLESDLALDRLAALRSTRLHCSDGATELIATTDATLSASCPELAEMTSESEDALGHAQHWEVRLSKAGMPLDGRIHARALRGEPPSLVDKTAAVVPWPLARKLSDIPSLLSDNSDYRHPVGAQFEGEEARTLRELRASFAMMLIVGDNGQDHAYVEEDGVTYTLSIRDDLPDEVEQRLSAFIDQSWSLAGPP
jgi:hypothetical protein